MFLSNHALTGAVIGTLTDNNAIIAPAAFASHFVNDAMPHFGHARGEEESPHDIRSKKSLYTAAADGVVTTAIIIGVITLRPDRAAHTLLGMLFAMLPDLFYIPDVLFNIKLDKHIRDFHWKIQWYEKPPGLATEITWAGLMIWAFLSSK